MLINLGIVLVRVIDASNQGVKRLLEIIIRLTQQILQVYIPKGANKKDQKINQLEYWFIVKKLSIFLVNHKKLDHEIIDHRILYTNYLSERSLKVVPVAIESSVELCLASCGENPNDFITVEGVFFKHCSFWFCQTCDHVFPIVPVWPHHCYQKLSPTHQICYIYLYVYVNHFVCV